VTLPALGTVLTATQIVSLHTVQGVQLYQVLGSDLIDLVWSRESETPSRCEVTLPSTLDFNRLPDVTPWLHWISVWDESGQELLWSGPIHKTSATRDTMTLSAWDMSSLFSRTRCPITKRWDVAWPVDIAEELIDYMLELHGLKVRPIVQPVRPKQYDERFDFSVSNDGTMLNSIIDNLARLGLRWTVVSGIPVLGQLPRTTIAALSENDFVGGGLVVVRDGADTYNDVLLRGADNLATARTDFGGLTLQTTVEIDDMFGVSNVDRAVRQYVRYAATIRDSVILPDNAVLHPNAPVTLAQLVPGARFVVDAYGLLVQAELTGLDVTCSSTTSAVSVRLSSVSPDEPELVVIQERASISGGTQ